MVVPNNLYDFGKLAVVAHRVYRPGAAINTQLVGVAAFVSKGKVTGPGAKATRALYIHIDDIVINAGRPCQGDAVYAPMIVELNDVV